MSSATNAVRWTPRRINAALKCPKPKGAIARVWRHEGGMLDGGPAVHPVELRLLAHIANTGDVLDVPAMRLEYDACPVRWLLVPMPEQLLDRLAAFGAEREDLEPDHDGEADADREPDVDDENGADEERADVRPDTMHRMGLDDDGPELQITPEQRQRYRAGDERQTLHHVKAFIRAHGGAR